MYTQVQILSLEKKDKTRNKTPTSYFLKTLTQIYLFYIEVTWIRNFKSAGPRLCDSYTCNPSTWEVKDKGLLQVRGQLKLQTKQDQWDGSAGEGTCHGTGDQSLISKTHMKEKTDP